ncbi:MAG: PD-(D/E)XK nuclease family protein, partial [Proteobacteria bacterium]|nr:PD-(D/E)XK nuclease family protein [Pseudomonadota bacterium]
SVDLQSLFLTIWQQNHYQERPALLASHSLTKLFLKQSLAKYDSALLGNSDLDHIRELLRFISHSQPLFHQGGSITDYLTLATLSSFFPELPQKTISPPILELLQKVVSDMEYRVTQAGYQTEEMVTVKMIQSLMVDYDSDPDKQTFWRQALAPFHEMIVVGFVRSTYFEQQMIRILMDQENVCFYQQDHTLLPENNRGQTALFNQPRLLPVPGFGDIILPSSQQEARPKIGLTKAKGDIKRAICAFSSPQDELNTFFTIAAELNNQGILPHEIGFIVPSDGEYRALLHGYKKLDLMKSMPTAALDRHSEGDHFEVLSLGLTTNLLSSPSGELMQALQRYLTSSRSLWDFGYLILQPKIYPWFLAHFITVTQKFSHSSHSSFSSATTELFHLKSCLSYFISEVSLATTTLEFLQEKSEKAKDQYCLKKFLSRQQVSHQDLKRIGALFFTESYQLIAPILSREQSFSEGSLSHRKEGFQAIFQLLKDTLVLPSDMATSHEREELLSFVRPINICIEEILVYLAQLSDNDFHQQFPLFTDAIAFVIQELEERTLQSTNNLLAGIQVTTLKKALMHSFKAVMVCGVKDPISQASYHSLAPWIMGITGHPHTENHMISRDRRRFEEMCLRQLWHRVPYQCYGHIPVEEGVVPNIFSGGEFADNIQIFSAKDHDKLSEFLYPVSAPKVKESHDKEQKICFSQNTLELTGRVPFVEPKVWERLSPSSLDTLLICPFRFYLQHKRVVSPVLPHTHVASEKAQWLHKLMENFFTGTHKYFSSNGPGFPFQQSDRPLSSLDPLSPDDDLSSQGLEQRLVAVADTLIHPLSLFSPPDMYELKTKIIPFIAQWFADFFTLHGWPEQTLCEVSIHGDDNKLPHLNGVLFQDTAEPTTLIGRIDLFMQLKDWNLIIDFKKGHLPSQDEIL